jgi:hypothetical protein
VIGEYCPAKRFFGFLPRRTSTARGDSKSSILSFNFPVPSTVKRSGCGAVKSDCHVILSNDDRSAGFDVGVFHCSLLPKPVGYVFIIRYRIIGCKGLGEFSRLFWGGSIDHIGDANKMVTAIPVGYLVGLFFPWFALPFPCLKPLYSLKMRSLCGCRTRIRRPTL